MMMKEVALILFCFEVALVEYGCRLAISTTSVVHEISHFTLAKFLEKSISFTWAQGKRFP
jgi:hypothetical protein